MLEKRWVFEPVPAGLKPALLVSSSLSSCSPASRFLMVSWTNPFGRLWETLEGSHSQLPLVEKDKVTVSEVPKV